MKIIHIVENLDKGAVENWLVRVFLESRKMRPHWEWTFYCILGREGRLDETVKAAGGCIVYAPVSISRKSKFVKHLRQVLKKGGYDIIHSHHDYLSGFYLLASRGIHFKKRILHIHNTDKALPVGNRVLHRLLLKPFEMMAFYFSDIITGISKDTLKEFTRDRKPGEKDFRVLYYGVDLSAFEQMVDPSHLRQELGMPVDSKILLFVGRMNEFKNPVFVIDILNEMLKRQPNVFAVFVGKGDEEANVQRRAEELGILDNIRLAGWRDDTAAIMKSADLFIFPRVEYPKEGLGLVIVEAQAAGLPMLLSHGIVEDAIVVPSLANFLSLDNDAKAWAEKAGDIINRQPNVTKEEALKQVQHSQFELRKATENLLSIYES